MQNSPAVSRRIVVEACVDSIDSARSATAAGAHRLEVCASLAEGGITPSAGLIAGCLEASALPVHVMIRPRGGDFVHGASELAVMRRDIAGARALGAAGVVLGVLTVAGRVDVDRTAELVSLSRPMSVTFHRAIDVALDLDEALEAVIRSGADRVLSSGGASTALAGVRRLAELVKRAAGRIRIIAAGGVRAENVRRILTETGLTEVHARCAVLRRGVPGRNPAIRFRAGPIPEDAVEVTDVSAMARLVAATR